MPNNRVLPVAGITIYNKTLKKIAALCEIAKKITSHLVRNTFATTITFENISLNSRILRRTNTPTGNALETSEVLSPALVFHHYK